jgi:pyruvate dehydrogenase E1 component alpha subunit
MARKKNSIDAEVLKKIYRTVVRIRHFEEQGIKLYRQGLIKGYFHPYLGQEGIAAGVCAGLQPGDAVASTHRGHGHCIAHGAEIKGMVAELLGRRDGYCKGYGGSMHIADIKNGNLGANGIVGAGSPLGVGAALASQIMDDGKVTVTFSTDGATNNGTFLESLNLAAIWNLAFVLVVENNQFAVSTPISEATRDTELFKRGEAIGVESHRVDGNNPIEVYECASKAVETCRNGKGPVLIEAVTYRHAGHHVNDPGSYMPEDTLAHYKSIDPIIRGRQALKDMAGLTDKQIDVIDQEVFDEYEDALAFAKASGEVTVEEFHEFSMGY